MCTLMFQDCAIVPVKVKLLAISFNKGNLSNSLLAGQSSHQQNSKDMICTQRLPRYVSYMQGPHIL